MNSGDEFIDFLKQKAGDYLRSVSRYTADAYDLVYIRDNLEESAMRERIELVHERVTATHERQSEERAELGETYTSVQIRDDAVVVHIPRENRTGTFVSLEPEAARQLVGFLAECVQREHPSSLPA